MSSTIIPQAWPLQVVTEVAGTEAVNIGYIVHNHQWAIRRGDIGQLTDLPQGTQLRCLAERWIEELEQEAAAANGEDNDATPLSRARVEWRRVLHNNHLRIGSGRMERPLAG